MNLSIIRDGHRFPYSERQLRLDNPNVSFPKDLSLVDLSAYGVVAELSRANVGAASVPEHQRIAMHCFLYGVREFGLRVQFERYMLGRRAALGAGQLGTAGLAALLEYQNALNTRGGTTQER